MEWGVLLVTAIGSSFLTKLVEIAAKGWRDRKRARGTLESERDLLARSRANLANELVAANIALQQGGLPARPWPDDPWLDRQKKRAVDDFE